MFNIPYVWDYRVTDAVDLSRNLDSFYKIFKFSLDLGTKLSVF